MQRIGILAGTFDPVHNGHIEFAKVSSQKFALDQVYFLPELKPRGKKTTAALNHRTEMLKRALESENNLELLQLDDERFSIDKTYQKLKEKFPTEKLVFLFGSDVAGNIPAWEGAGYLGEVIIALREKAPVSELKTRLEELGIKTQFMISPSGKISSSGVRAGKHKNIPSAVEEYI